MSFSALGDLNWLAVIVAAIAFFALGGLWYATPVFGKAWVRSIADPPPEFKSGAAVYLVPALTCLISTIATALIAVATETDTIGEGLVLGLVVGVGLAGASVMVTGFFDPQKAQPATNAAISAGYQVVGLVIVAVIVALWQ